MSTIPIYNPAVDPANTVIGPRPGDGPGAVDKTGSGAIGVQGASTPPVTRQGQSKIDLTPTGRQNATQQEIEEAQSRFEGALGQLNLTLYTDIGAIIARALVEQTGLQRANAVLQKTLAIQSVQGALLNEAQKDRDAADKMRSSALTTMIISVVVSSVTIVVSAISLGNSLKQGRAQDRAKELDEVATDVAKNVNAGGKVDADVVEQINDAATAAADVATKVGAEAKRVNEVLEMVKKLTELTKSLGDYFQRLSEADIKNLEADAKELAAQAQYLQTLVERQKANEEALNEFIKAMVKFLADLAEAFANAHLGKF